MCVLPSWERAWRKPHDSLRFSVMTTPPGPGALSRPPALGRACWQEGVREAGVQQEGVREAGVREAGVRAAGMWAAGVREAGVWGTGVRHKGFRAAAARVAGLQEARVVGRGAGGRGAGAGVRLGLLACAQCLRGPTHNCPLRAPATPQGAPKVTLSQILPTRCDRCAVPTSPTGSPCPGPASQGDVGPHCPLGSAPTPLPPPGFLTRSYSGPLGATEAVRIGGSQSPDATWVTSRPRGPWRAQAGCLLWTGGRRAPLTSPFLAPFPVRKRTHRQSPENLAAYSCQLP